MSEASKAQISLQERRQWAAELSAGTSSEAIYSCFEATLVQLMPKGTVLDWGAGQGILTHRLLHLETFSSITAVDIQPCPKLIDPTVQWIQADLNNSLDVADESFDFIVSAEVIEHLENPRATAREWFRLLRPGGTLIFSTPNNESWRSLLSLLLNGHFVAFGDSSYPAHITALVRKDLERILLETGFNSSKFTFTDSGGIPKLPHIKWQAILSFCKGVRYSDNVLVIAHKPK